MRDGTAVGARRAGAAQCPHRASRRGTALLTGKMGTAEKVTWKFVGFCVFVVKYIGVTKQEPNAKLMQTKKRNVKGSAPALKLRFLQAAGRLLPPRQPPVPLPLRARRAPGQPSEARVF